MAGKRPSHLENLMQYFVIAGTPSMRQTAETTRAFAMASAEEKDTAKAAAQSYLKDKEGPKQPKSINPNLDKARPSRANPKKVRGGVGGGRTKKPEEKTWRQTVTEKLRRTGVSPLSSKKTEEEKPKGAAKPPKPSARPDAKTGSKLAATPPPKPSARPTKKRLPEKYRGAKDTGTHAQPGGTDWQQDAYITHRAKMMRRIEGDAKKNRSDDRHPGTGKSFTQKPSRKTTKGYNDSRADVATKTIAKAIGDTRSWDQMVSDRIANQKIEDENR